MRNVLSLLVLVGLTACSGSGPQPVPPPVDTNMCAAAGQNLQKLQCRDPKGNPLWVNLDGVSFEQTCTIDQQEGRVSVSPTCVAKSSTCPEAEQCPAQ